MEKEEAVSSGSSWLLRAAFQGARSAIRAACTQTKRLRAFNDEHCGAVVLCTPLKAYKKKFHAF
jgi:hypothetical protein